MSRFSRSMRSRNAVPWKLQFSFSPAVNRTPLAAWRVMPPGGFLYRRAKLARASAAVRRKRRGTGECSAGDTVSPRAVGDGTHRADRSWLIFTASATTGDAGQAAAVVRSTADLSTPRSISPASRRAGPVPVAAPRPRGRAAPGTARSTGADRDCAALAAGLSGAIVLNAWSPPFLCPTGCLHCRAFFLDSARSALCNFF